jgi:hypothetical protein
MSSLSRRATASRVQRAFVGFACIRFVPIPQELFASAINAIVVLVDRAAIKKDDGPPRRESDMTTRTWLALATGIGGLLSTAATGPLPAS